MTVVINGVTGIDTVQDGVISAPKLNGAQSSSAPIYGARAWCVFDGTLTGTNAPISGGNITSITRTATGTYTVNLTNGLPSNQYCIVGMIQPTESNSWSLNEVQGTTRTTTQFQVRSTTQSATLTDAARIHISVFG